MQRTYLKSIHLILLFALIFITSENKRTVPLGIQYLITGDVLLWGPIMAGAVLAASLMLVLPEIADSTPSKKVAQDYVAAYEKMYGTKPATFGANVYDAGLLLQRAIPEAAKRGKPGTP